ncbi:MAG: TRAP transporter large permease [Deltaproteobacteria bacterium]|nr:TRAP transporter large permease [Deltaproteobacteria bacterium]MBI3076998.1 TRAP transporter large permease [Deltaproteobacteria bacterium]
MGLFLLGSFLLFLAAGVPFAFALGLSSLGALLLQGDLPLMVMVQRMVVGADSFPLMAVPFFMLVGTIMSRGGISRRLVEFANTLIGSLHGGLSLVAVFTSMLFAGISGSAPADTAAVGSIMIPSMKRHGYRADFAAALQASGGSIGVIIPPSIPMVVFGALTATSIGGLFVGGYIPGLLAGLALMGVATVISRRRGYRGEGAFSVRRVWQSFHRALLALLAPGIIVGGILGGIFTPTESGVVGVAYVLLLSLVIYREMSPGELYRALLEAAELTAMVLLIVATASIFSWMLAIGRVPQAVGEVLGGLTRQPWLFLLVLNLFLLFMGCFMDMLSGMIILLPILMPLVQQAGIDPIHFGVVFVFNLAVGMLTPPFGVCLFVAMAIARVSLEEIGRAVLPFLVAMIAILVLIMSVPEVVLFLPRLLRL